MDPRSPTPGPSPLPPRPAGGVGPGRTGTPRVRIGSLILLLAAAASVPSQLLSPPALSAQGSWTGQGHAWDPPLPVSGAAIPSHLVGLEDTHLRYLAAWNDDDPSSLLEHLAHGVGALTRSGLVEAGAARELLRRVVPRVRVLEASIYLVDAADGWVSVGTLLQMEMDPRAEGGEARLGSTTTVWERGPDDRWRVVFLGALWIGAEEEGVVAAPRRVGRADPLPTGSPGGTNSLAPRGRGG